MDMGTQSTPFQGIILNAFAIFSQKPQSNCFIPFGSHLSPTFHAIGPSHSSGFSPHPRLTGLNEYVQRSMEGDYSRVARNIYFSVCMSFRLRMYASPYICLSVCISLPPCVLPSMCMSPSCARPSTRMFLPCMSRRVYVSFCSMSPTCVDSFV